MNSRKLSRPETIQRRISILEEFPDPGLESVVIQWKHCQPTVLVQLKKNHEEPVQFPGQRPEFPGIQAAPKGQVSALDLPLTGFVDAATARVFGGAADEADLLFSNRAFSLLQPEPDLVLPLQALWECRVEALSALGIPDEPLCHEGKA